MLLDGGADTAARNELSATALHHATRSGCKDIVDLLLNRSDVHARSSDGYIAPHLAAMRGDLSTFQVLFRESLKINPTPESIARDHNGATVLHLAALHDQVEIVSLLLEEGFDIDERDNLGDTALHYAILEGAILATKLLLEKGSDINIQTTIV